MVFTNEPELLESLHVLHILLIYYKIVNSLVLVLIHVISNKLLDLTKPF